MTAFADDPVLGMLTDQTDRLLQSVAELDDADLRAPSLLPGWTRGHVLTHVARNADALSNVVRSAITGENVPMYASTEARDAAIEQGSGRSPADLEADIESSAERLLALLADVPMDGLDTMVPTGRGWDLAVRDVPRMRLREVTYHHVDLATGFGFDDLPDEVVRAGLQECPPRFRDVVPGATVTARWDDGTQTALTIGDGAVPVEGSAAHVLAWLTGRSGGAGLTTRGNVPLPALPSWG
ncbi:MAG TPA: maleylpyruvate isomerase family mycothiol-dependent enzyme [Actinomycetales bacterium]|nr:maleylpyruvate isomerase family mycothiol-dependent enzyme [Actinomycetales bacterium]